VDFENQSRGSTDLIVDLSGLFKPGHGAQFVPLAPSRILDTRTPGYPDARHRRPRRRSARPAQGRRHRRAQRRHRCDPQIVANAATVDTAVNGGEDLFNGSLAGSP
jgi:hypothetical protein